ncbi:MAG TPA: hypothetical protein VFN85_00620, partial [Solirubrobacterales bacterium]|nr:hypothetical protein [Solirubrobacterales bacterium]
MVLEGGRDLVLGSARRWDPAENLPALDAAAVGLSWPVVVAGDVGDGAVPRHALSTGELDGATLGKLRREAPIYAAPAIDEPAGRGVFEAACDCCALVLSDIPTLRDLWEDAAIFVEPR